jgi:hypothetical protein
MGNLIRIFMYTAILIIIEVSQRFSSSNLVLKTVESCSMALNYYENGSISGNICALTLSRTHTYQVTVGQKSSSGHKFLMLDPPHTLHKTRMHTHVLMIYSAHAHTHTRIHTHTQDTHTHTHTHILCHVPKMGPGYSSIFFG